MAPTDTKERFRAAFAAHYRAVFSYAARRVGRDDAADITADVFTTAWRRVADLPTEPDVLPWLYGVARRTLANHRRGAARRVRLLARARSQPAAGSGAVDDPIVVREALDHLRPADREVLMLAAWEELTPAEIATVLDISPQAARVRLHRARRRFADELGTEFGGMTDA